MEMNEILVFALGWIITGCAWIMVDAYWVGTVYCSPAKTLMNAALWPWSVATRSIAAANTIMK